MSEAGLRDGHAIFGSFRSLRTRASNPTYSCEVWIDARLALVFEAPDVQTARAVAEGFKAPAFPLTFGPSDSLLKAVAVRAESVEPISARSLAYVLVFREILPNYSLHGSSADIPFHRSIRALRSNGCRPGSLLNRMAAAVFLGERSSPS